MEQVTGFKLNIEWLLALSEDGGIGASVQRPRGHKAMPQGRLAQERLYALPALGESLKPIYSMNQRMPRKGPDFGKHPKPPIEVALNYRISVQEAAGVECLARYDSTGEIAFARRQTPRGTVRPRRRST